jgi:hypothetical protein
MLASLTPSANIACARIVDVLVPSPTTSPVQVMRAAAAAIAFRATHLL